MRGSLTTEYVGIIGPVRIWKQAQILHGPVVLIVTEMHGRLTKRQLSQSNDEPQIDGDLHNPAGCLSLSFALHHSSSTTFVGSSSFLDQDSNSQCRNPARFSTVFRHSRMLTGDRFVKCLNPGLPAFFRTGGRW